MWLLGITAIVVAPWEAHAFITHVALPRFTPNPKKPLDMNSPEVGVSNDVVRVASMWQSGPLVHTKSSHRYMGREALYIVPISTRAGL